MKPKKPPDLGKVLGSRQASILEYLWLNGPQSVADLHRGLARLEDLAYTTVFTELTRMLRKRFVAKSNDGGTHLDMRYRAAITREDLVASVVSDTLGSLIAAHGSAAVHGFVNAVSHDPASLEELRRVLNARRNKR